MGPILPLLCKAQPPQRSPAPLPGTPCAFFFRIVFPPIQTQHICAPSRTPIWALPDLHAIPSPPHHTASAPWPGHPTRSPTPTTGLAVARDLGNIWGDKVATDVCASQGALYHRHTRD
ncbi:unnamed protein product [Rangifer tarandus platyrhynchus]|uniref:Uncharacterized protein n=2 Tax=Rangifer tarandus platyrhynchus TaxID=3082113 RepID=A0AC59Z4L7_RANTA|nr:unnamed protein product [Rangifer tarandus platyrhynchus]